MKECCCKSVFSGQMKRIGRCNYKCDKCGDDVSMLWAFYSLSQQEKQSDDSTLRQNLITLEKLGVTPASQDKE